MKYLLLIAVNPEMYESDERAPMQAWMDYSEALAGSGALVAGEGLQGLETATTVTVADGETVITDGPFAETKEMLAGFYLVDLPDLDTALRWAAKMPSIGYGSVEVRPVMTYDQVPAAS